ncbi:hypothetical protein QM306_37895, partial [Burkholderia cenocepacia]|nr:hypothetical protein [Burkholderia cenocepacia]
DGARGHLPPGLEVLPAARSPVPLLVAGLAQQTPAWIGEHMDGCLAYPGTPAWRPSCRRLALPDGVQSLSSGSSMPMLKPPAASLSREVGMIGLLRSDRAQAA